MTPEEARLITANNAQYASPRLDGDDDPGHGMPPEDREGVPEDDGHPTHARQATYTATVADGISTHTLSGVVYTSTEAGVLRLERGDGSVTIISRGHWDSVNTVRDAR